MQWVQVKELVTIIPFGLQCNCVASRYIADSQSCSLMDIGRVGYFMETADDIVSPPVPPFPDLPYLRKMSTQRLE